MPTETVERMLSKAIGLDPSSIGEAAFSRAVRSRLLALSLESIDVYRAYLTSRPPEIQNLIEAVVVPETWFFREPEAFATMVKHVSERSTKDPTAVLRLLSVPCSTGEEPYSIAMALIDAGYPPDRFRIDAVDVSALAIAQALRGIYRKNSFRGTNLGFRARHFEATPEGAVITAAVKNHVRFERANLLDADFIPGQKLYDVIFCRNMLIYFDDAARDKAVAILDRLLADDGIIFVGPSESGLMLDHDLVAVKAPLAFAFQKSSKTKLKVVPPHMNQFSIPQSREVRRPKASVPRSVRAPPLPQAGNLALKIEEIGRMADQGLLEEAGRACEAYLRQGEPTADLLLLLGLVREAAGSSDGAADCYRKALYLDSNHAQVLMHLALLLEKQGDIAGAKIMNDRLRRQARK